MKNYIAIMALTAACSSHTEETPAFTLADGADLASTAGFLATDNGVELNPLIAGSTTAETIVRGGVVKLGARALVNAIPMEDRHRKNWHTSMDAVGWGATVNNIPLIFGGSAAPVLGVAVALGYFAYNVEEAPTDEAE